MSAMYLTFLTFHLFAKLANFAVILEESQKYWCSTSTFGHLASTTTPLSLTPLLWRRFTPSLSILRHRASHLLLVQLVSLPLPSHRPPAPVFLNTAILLFADIGGYNSLNLLVDPSIKMIEEALSCVRPKHRGSASTGEKGVRKAGQYSANSQPKQPKNASRRPK